MIRLSKFKIVGFVIVGFDIGTAFANYALRHGARRWTWWEELMMLYFAVLIFALASTQSKAEKELLG